MDHLIVAHPRRNDSHFLFSTELRQSIISNCSFQKGKISNSLGLSDLGLDNWGGGTNK